MSKSKPVLLPHISFESEAKALEHFRKILNSYKLGETLKGQDYKDVEALVYNHPRYQDKIKGGIKQIVVKSDMYGGQCFHILRTDNTFENFSYLKCIRGDASPFTLFSYACRKIVAEDMKMEKEQYFLQNQNKEGKILCPLTQKLISRKESHLDHNPVTFSVITEMFIQKMGLDLSKVEYSKEGEYGHVLADENLKSEFLKLHRKLAKYRVIQDTMNLSLNYEAKVARIKFQQLEGAPAFYSLEN